MTARAAAVVVAAGRAERMGARQNKVFLTLGTRPVLWHAVAAFARHPEVEQIVAVVAAGEEARCALALDGLPRVEVCTGGPTRQDSVACGLARVGSDCEVVLVHDGARPLVGADLIGRVLDAARANGAALPALPVTDSLKRVRDGRVVDELAREGVFSAQTPQGFWRKALTQALAQAQRQNFCATDDAAAVWRFCGLACQVVAGDPANFKLTVPGDLDLAAAWLDARGDIGART